MNSIKDGSLPFEGNDGSWNTYRGLTEDSRVGTWNWPITEDLVG